MSKREHRRFTAEQKLEILREAEQPGVTVSELCRRHGLSPSVLYRWRSISQGGSAVSLHGPSAPDRSDATRSADDVLVCRSPAAVVPLFVLPAAKQKLTKADLGL